ncbi:MAG: Outer-membrane lipoprotein carrier protein [Candidatus Erwinia impunctatus]|nr:Outer-membrane lipoprotein carrier protein [Culicoides impunctatus]
MKKTLPSAILLVAAAPMMVFAQASTDLQQRLAKLNSFQATFTQQVTDASGQMVQEGKGELAVKRPNLFNWHMTSPDESVLISDGKTLWFYNPFVEQASASRLSDATSNTPFMLIARNQREDWAQYDVSQAGDTFTLTPKSANNNLKQFVVDVTAAGTIRQFTSVEQDGQRSRYQLNAMQSSAVSSDKFTFTPPAGVTVDDQRK